MDTHAYPDRPVVSIVVKLVAALAVMVVMVAGIFFWGRLADDDRTAMLLTAAWFAMVAVAGVLLTRTHTSLRLPLASGFLIVAAAATVLLGLPMLGDDVVNERVVTARPATAAPTASSGMAGSRNTQIASGSFQPIAHPGAGTASVVKLEGGERLLTLTAFETDNGPDLRVYLSTGNPAGSGQLGQFEDLGALKGNKGSQQYKIPADVDVGRFSTVVIWCRAFSVGFTSATLKKT